MTRQEKIQAVVLATGVSPASAESRLEAEGWLVEFAVFSIRVDRLSASRVQNQNLSKRGSFLRI